MGKKQKIRAGTGDLVAMPIPLDKQIEKSKLTKSKVKLNKKQQKNVDIEEDTEEVSIFKNLIWSVYLMMITLITDYQFLNFFFKNF